MSNITIHDLQHDSAKLLDRVAAGERLVVVRDGQPVAELRPIGQKRTTPRPIGLAAGRFTVPEDFDAPLPEKVLREFEGQ